MESPFEVLRQIIGILDALSVRYVVVGSMASSTRGIARATGDVDIVTDLTPSQVAPFIIAVRPAFYADERRARMAAQSGRSFNLIHVATAFKVDIFIPPPNGFGWQQLAERQIETLLPDMQVYVSTAEDTVLSKLEWFVKGGGISERQWTDVLGIIKVQGANLDAAYLRDWAVRLGVLELLEKAFDEARQ